MQILGYRVILFCPAWATKQTCHFLLHFALNLLLGFGQYEERKKLNSSASDRRIFSRVKSFADLGVVFETASCFACAQVPQAKGLVPGSGQSVVSIAGEDHVGDEVRVTVQPLTGDSVVHVVPRELPDDQSLI